MNERDPWVELRRHAAFLHGGDSREIVIEIGRVHRVLRCVDGGLVELETTDPNQGARSPTTLGCIASALARRAQSNVYAKQKALVAAERALAEARHNLKIAEARYAELEELAGATPAPKEPDGTA